MIARRDAANDQRRRILRTTADLVSKRGYQDTTTELIVRRAKVGYGTFYKFFPDKESCFLALFDATFERASKALTEAYHAEEETKPWADRVADSIALLYQLTASDPAVARACLVESLTAGPKVLARYEAALQQLTRILQPGRELAPEGGAALPRTLETTLAGGILWIAYQLLIVGEAERLEAMLPEAIQFALSPYLGEEAAVELAERRATPATEAA